MLSPLMMKCYNMKNLLKKVLDLSEEGYLVDENLADKICKVIEGVE